MSDDQSKHVIAFYGRTAEDYDREYDIPYFKLLYDKITWHYIEPYLPEDGLVLDAGGGTGKWSIPMAERGLKVTLYDISPDMLRVARRKIEERRLQNLIQTVEGDICEIDYPDSYFDFVLAEGDPISYCSDPHKAVRELARVLKAGSYICAGVDSLFSAVRSAVLRQDLEAAFNILKEGKFYAKDWGFHCWAFTPESLRRLFEDANLHVVKIVGKTVLYTRVVEPLLQDPEKAGKLLELELTLCEEQSIVGFGGHLHIVARKPSL